MKASLQAYKRKRDFTRTREPAGKPKTSSGRRRALRFVVQKHAARRLHYDFRLEMDGVLKSWAVPKGIPTAKGPPRLAVEVEDHPIEYGRFEGIIPAGNYGAGTVQLWDRGTYQVDGEQPAKAWREGKLSLVLHGKKLQGHWTLVRTRGEGKPANSWLLIKTGENLPERSAGEMDRSVLSGKTIEELSRSRKAWRSSREPAKGSTGTFKARIAAIAAARRGNEHRAASVRGASHHR